MVSKWKIDNFFRETNFELLKVKIQDILTHENCIEALKGETSMHAHLPWEEKIEMVERSEMQFSCA